MRLVPWLIVLTLAWSAPACAEAKRATNPRAPRMVKVISGASIAGIRIGMTRDEVKGLGLSLVPEGIERMGRKGWVSGPLLILVDDADRVVLVSLELRKSTGALIDGHAIPARATLAGIERVLPCTRAAGSGGDELTCKGPSGIIKIYDAHTDADAVWIHLGGG